MKYSKVSHFRTVISTHETPLSMLIGFAMLHLLNFPVGILYSERATSLLLLRKAIINSLAS